MTERDKMLAGQLYDCGDKELLEWEALSRKISRVILWHAETPAE